jgi:hypothetical protein
MTCWPSSRRVSSSWAESLAWRNTARPITHGNAMPRIQMPTEMFPCVSIKLTTIGAATANTPSTPAITVDSAQHATTYARIETSNIIGSWVPERCTATTAPTTSVSGVAGMYAHSANAATGTPPGGPRPYEGRRTAPTPSREGGSYGAIGRRTTLSSSSPAHQRAS